MKKVISCLLTAAILAATCAGLCACKEEDAGEPFLGVTSEQTFESAEKAAQAFFQEEICGEGDSIVFVKYEKKGELSESEISALALSEADRAELVSAERGEVVYNYKDEEVASLAADDEEIGRPYRIIECRQKMFLLHMKSACKYYVPPVEIGERLTKSYYMSLFAMDKYANCTINFNYYNNSDKPWAVDIYKFDGEVSAWLESVYMGKSIKRASYTIPYQNKSVDITNMNFSDDNTPIVPYFASPEDGTPQESFYSAFNEALMIGENWHYVKTEEGFALAAPLFAISEYIAVVKNNRLSEVTFSYQEIIPPEGIAKYTYHYTFSDFGTTKVEIPAEVQKLYDEFVKEQEAK